MTREVFHSSRQDEGERLLCREHSWTKCAFICCGLSMCITVDILQYSMPLAFLPSVLEDRGHSTIKIASAVGIYYWTGFLGGVLITSYQILRLLCIGGKESSKDTTTLSQVRQQIWFLVGGLAVGTVTLLCQAFSPHYNVHIVCRFIQGFAGAFIFFYSFLLSVSLFKSQSSQQDFAMTTASMALNVAEVLGSLLGAVIFDAWGQRSVFWFLGVASILNQIILVAVIYSLSESEEFAEKVDDSWDWSQVRSNVAWGRVRDVVQSRRLLCAVVLIAVSALVKGAVEEMLPFHADHQWGMDPLKIGQLFAIVAFAYIAAAACAGRIWRSLTHRMLFSASWLAFLGLSALIAFSLAGYFHHMEVFWMALVGYGVCLGLTHTPAALLLADAIEHEDGVAKDAVNGIWNTMWEAGGSLGFLLGGLLAEHYGGQLRLLTGCAVCCVASAGVMVLISSCPADCIKGRDSKGTPVAMEKKPHYGTLA